MSTCFFGAAELARVATMSVCRYSHNGVTKDLCGDLADFSKANADAFNVRYPREAEPAQGCTAEEIFDLAPRTLDKEAAMKACRTVALMDYNLDGEATVSALVPIIRAMQSDTWMRFGIESRL